MSLQELFSKVIAWGMAVILLTIFLDFFIINSLTELAKESGRPSSSTFFKVLTYVAKGLIRNWRLVTSFDRLAALRNQIRAPGS